MFSDIAIKILNKFGLSNQYLWFCHYLAHNKKVFNSSRHGQSRKRIILMELNTMHSAHIAYSYLANALAIEGNAKIIGYIPKA